MSNQTPVLGSLSHFCLSVSDYEKSIKYYDTILKKLGYKQFMQKEYYTGWVNTLCGVQFGISSVRPEYKDSKHQRYSVGFNHLALNATSREQVDEFHEFLLENKVTILDEPKEYEYVPGYYAVFWEDPDGMKLELCYVPIPSPEENSENSESVKVDDTDGVEPEGKDHEGNGESDENSPKRQKLE
ncbi:Glyoxalase/Bleomycin resistance protein/Dihydroxybiphenyl dioxygenase [Glomus cerebriforme]|uniref:Glyoxalase/Bleomycin resistance protein/Dihydroxybiphenyl dioxygenase n=1 Tax=Glomus cerebriforme TaxID=658196 RepID=A0A397TFE0_9GLOM|nr:Glyoxalase/Bleomycin resistance protein/Dihydroxybiphenyl dioxygenase [Glomus cerebriforme]